MPEMHLYRIPPARQAQAFPLSMSTTAKRLVWILVFVTLSACGDSSETAVAAPESESDRSAAVPLLELDDGITWSALLGSIASGQELDCVAETIRDEDLPEDFLDLAVVDAATGGSAWPVWYQEILGIEVGENHWPHELWRCLAPRTAAAVYVTVGLDELRRAGTPVAGSDDACILRLPADAELSGAVSERLSSQYSFPDGEDLSGFFEELDYETVIPGLLSCLSDTPPE